MATSKHERLTRLRECLSTFAAGTRTIRSTGFLSLDRLLPQGGLQSGSVVELLDERVGCGASSFAAALTRQVCLPPANVVVIDRDRQFNPLAATAWRLSLDRLIVIQARTDADDLWAATQSLRCRAVGVVWLRCERLLPHDFRRLRLAAEEGGVLAILFRPAQVRGRPTWADVQLAIAPLPSVHSRRLRVEVVRCRGGNGGGTADITLNDSIDFVSGNQHHDALCLHPVASMADSKTLLRTTGIAPKAAAALSARFPSRQMCR